MWPAARRGFILVLVSIAVSSCDFAPLWTSCCYNEVLEGKWKQSIAGSDVSTVGRYTDDHRPVTFGFRFEKLNVDNLRDAPGGTVVLMIPTEFQNVISSASVTLGPPSAMRILRLRIVNRAHVVVMIPVPVNDIIAKGTIVTTLPTPRHPRGWLPRRVCVAYLSDTISPRTIVAAFDFALPGGRPPLQSQLGTPDGMFGC